MRIILSACLLCILFLPTRLSGADRLNEALVGIQSEDSSTYYKAHDFLLKHPNQAETPLRALLKDYSTRPFARIRAAVLLGQIGNHEAVPDLKTALFSGDETNAAVKSQIIISLAKLGGKQIVIDYYNRGTENSPAVVAAIALSLRGLTDDESKKVLASLLSSTDDERVERAALLAITTTEKPNSTRGEPSSNPPGLKLPTPGDQAIFAALKAKGKENDTELGKQAQALVQDLSKIYQQPQQPQEP